MTFSFRRRFLAVALCGLPVCPAHAATSQPSTAPTTAAEYDRLAESLHRSDRADPTVWPRERDAWLGAIRLDPHDQTALHALLDLEIESVQFGAASANHLRTATDAVLADDPANVRAGVWRKVADVLARLSKPGADVDKPLRAATEAIKAHPEQSDAAQVVTAVLCGKAHKAVMRGEPEAATRLIDEGVSLFEPCLAARPDDPVTLMRGYDLFHSADLLDRQARAKNAATAPTTAPSPYAARIPELLERARKRVDAAANPAAAAEISIATANFRRSQGDVAGAVRAVRDGMAIAPDNQMLRIELASLLRNDPAGRREVIELLERPVTDAGGLKLSTFYRRDTLVMLTRLTLIDALLAEHAATPAADVKARSALIDQAARAMDELEKSGHAGNVAVLKAKARVALARGGHPAAIEAVEALEKARGTVRRTGGPQAGPAAVDWDVELLLSDAYLVTGQTGLAETELWRIIEGRPELLAPHIALAQLLLKQHDVDLARDQIDAVRKLAPTSAELPKLEAQLAIAEAAAHDTTDAADALKTMPETTPAEVRAKASVAIAAKEFDEADRLLEHRLKDEPAEFETVRMLVNAYLSQNRRADAGRIVDAALAKSPDHIGFQLLRARVDNDSAKVAELTHKGISDIKDPLERQLALYGFYAAQNASANANAHLAMAESLAPDDPRVWDARFTASLRARKWADAEQYAARLGEKNFDEANGLIYQYRLHFAQRDPAAAERDAREMVHRFPQFARGYEYLGDTLRAQKHYEEALTNYTAALKRRNDSLESLKGAILSCEALGRNEDAKRYLDEAARLFPDDAWISQHATAAH